MDNQQNLNAQMSAARADLTQDGPAVDIAGAVEENRVLTPHCVFDDSRRGRFSDFGTDVYQQSGARNERTHRG